MEKRYLRFDTVSPASVPTMPKGKDGRVYSLSICSRIFARMLSKSGCPPK